MNPGEFKFKEGRIKMLAETSLCCKLNNRSPVRRLAVAIALNPWFDYFIMFTIFLNSVCMGMFDY